MKQIPVDSKILSISHNDEDGVVSQIVLGQVYSDITYLNTSFYRIDSVLESIVYSDYDYVYVTDINPESKDLLDISDKIILIDHHESAVDAHDVSKMHYVMPGKCAAYRVKVFIEKYYGRRLYHLDDMVELTNIYDMWDRENDRFDYAKRLNDLMFYKYRPKKFRDLFFDGRTDFTEEEVNWLNKRDKEFDRLYDSLTVFDFDKINGCIVQSKEFINEICDKLMRDEGYNIIFCRNPYHGRVSIRHNLPPEELDIGTMLKNKNWGGGHACSAGMFCDDIDDFQMKSKVLEELISETHSRK